MFDTFFNKCLVVAMMAALSNSLTFAPASSQDKTGTNPINFSFDARIYNENIWLNSPENSEQNSTTLEFRAPIFEGNWQFRARTRFVDVSLDTDGDGKRELNESGIGDTDFRFLTVPYTDFPNKIAIATGIEVFLPTAEKGLGSRRLSFGPQVFAVFFSPFGISDSLIAPAYQHKFSVYEETLRYKDYR